MSLRDTPRCAYALAIIYDVGWKWVFLGLLGFVSGVGFLRDEFSSPELGAKLKMPSLLPGLKWYWWAMVALVLLCFSLLEAAYRKHRKLQIGTDTDVAELKWRLAVAESPRIRELRENIKSLEHLCLSGSSAMDSNVVKALREFAFLVKDFEGGALEPDLHKIDSAAHRIFTINESQRRALHSLPSDDQLNKLTALRNELMDAVRCVLAATSSGVGRA